MHGTGSMGKYQKADNLKIILQLKEASTHNSALTHAGTIFVPRDLDP